jgi:hypothetical protein
MIGRSTCEARKTAEVKRRGKEEGEIIVHRFLVSISYSPFSLKDDPLFVADQPPRQGSLGEVVPSI